MSGKPTKKNNLATPWFKKQFAPNKPYQEESRKKPKKFLLLCEGKNTEPGYFKAFPVVSASVKAFGYGSSKTALVEYAIEVAKEDRYQGHEVWVVFDFDIKPDQLSQQKEDYNRAIEMAKREKFKVAYSNDAFELWFVLHFQEVEGKFNRYHFYERLSDFLEINYEKKAKERKFCTQLYRRLADHPKASQAKAIVRAKKLMGRCTHLPHADRCPCTTVFELVDSLNQYLKP